MESHPPEVDRVKNNCPDFFWSKAVGYSWNRVYIYLSLVRTKVLLYKSLNKLLQSSSEKPLLES